MNRLQAFIVRLFKIELGFTAGDIADASAKGFAAGREHGAAEARANQVTRFAVLPLPFTEAQLRGVEYGDFITACGEFAVKFGECNIPAPGPHGYEQRAYYVSKYDLEHRPADMDLRCHGAAKFHEPENSPELVPVIVTVLR